MITTAKIMTQAFIRTILSKFFQTGGKDLSAGLAKKLARSLATGEQVAFTKAEYAQVRRFARNKSRVKNIEGADINLRTDYYPNLSTGKAGPMHMIDYKKTPIIDLDLPDSLGSHVGAQIRYQNYTDAMKGIDKYLKTPAGQASSFDIYGTNAGLRLFDTARRMSPLQYANTSRLVGSDQYFIGHSLMRGKFGARVSPKPGRTESVVANPLERGYGEGTPLAKNIREIRVHDKLISTIQETKTPSDIEELTSLLEMAYPEGGPFLTAQKLNIPL
tara:strand:+ start:278 stop:1099 length:822 start_codon:yes stop_codon:yes gene_type:complete